MDVMEQLNLPGQKPTTAPLWRRLLAFIVDILLLDIVILGPLASLLPDTTLTVRAYAVVVSAALVMLGYFWLFEYLLAQTPGKMLFRLRVEKVTFWRAFVRNLYFVPITPLPLLLLVEPLYLAWRRVRLLEQLTGTKTTS